MTTSVFGHNRICSVNAATQWPGSSSVIEQQNEYQAVLVKDRRVNHLLHFVVGIFTLSVWWLFVWLPLGVFGGEKRRMITVDAYGNVAVTKGRG